MASILNVLSPFAIYCYLASEAVWGKGRWESEGKAHLLLISHLTYLHALLFVDPMGKKHHTRRTSWVFTFVVVVSVLLLSLKQKLLSLAG